MKTVEELEAEVEYLRSKVEFLRDSIFDLERDIDDLSEENSYLRDIVGRNNSNWMVER